MKNNTKKVLCVTTWAVPGPSGGGRCRGAFQQVIVYQSRQGILPSSITPTTECPSSQAANGVLAIFEVKSRTWAIASVMNAKVSRKGSATMTLWSKAVIATPLSDTSTSGCFRACSSALSGIVQHGSFCVAPVSSWNVSSSMNGM